LICGTGIGMSIAANKFPGVRATPAANPQTAEICRRHNDCNVLCLPGDLGDPLLQATVRAWIDAPFEGGRHQRRVEKIARLERS
jgi:ribose 5-phosphate isomerase B